MIAVMETERKGPLAIRVDATDNVAVATRVIEAEEVVVVDGERVIVGERVEAGHKIALRDVAVDEQIIKYGFPIGRATAPIARGAWVHSHNLRTQLDDARAAVTARSTTAARSAAGDAMPTFAGYRRADGRVGTRNEVWVLNTVGCVNFIADGVARDAAQRFRGAVDGIHAFGHPFGCSQLGDDLVHTQRILAGLLDHPNAGGVLVLGLGCENNQLDALLARAPGIDRSRLRHFNTQDVIDERDAAMSAIGELVTRMADDRRVDVPVSSLVLGHKCGGSDGFSGLTANPLVGLVADRLTALGGTVILTEVPEMFGAEQVLMARAASDAVQGEIAAMIDGFKTYFTRHGQPVYENPSPGNKAGGLTTLEEKSLGAIQKGGRATVTDVVRYGERARTSGLTLLEAPGNDAVSSTAMTASGATALLFTTGRGTPLGFPVPTIKISSNSDIAQRKPHWIDFNAGALVDGERTMDQLADELFAYVVEVASGRALTNHERRGHPEIAIWKDGVTL